MFSAAAPAGWTAENIHRAAGRYVAHPRPQEAPSRSQGCICMCRPVNMDELPRIVYEPGTSSDTVRHKAAVRHPVMGWGRRPSALPGIAPSADGAMDDWGFRAVRGAGFRPLRRAGVSRRARRDQRPCLWTPRFFEKNRVKLLYYCVVGQIGRILSHAADFLAAISS